MLCEGGTRGRERAPSGTGGALTSSRLGQARRETQQLGFAIPLPNLLTGCKRANEVAVKAFHKREELTNERK